MHDAVSFRFSPPHRVVDEFCFAGSFVAARRELAEVCPSAFEQEENACYRERDKCNDPDGNAGVRSSAEAFGRRRSRAFTGFGAVADGSFSGLVPATISTMLDFGVPGLACASKIWLFAWSKTV